MAKRSKAPTNLGQGIPRVGGELVDRLNKLDEGLGTALAYELNHRFSLADVRSRAAAGHAGTVVIAEQPRDSVGNKAAAIDVSGGNVAGSGWATQGDHLTPLSQVRSLFTCDRFGGHPSGFPGWFEECVQAERQAATPFTPIPGLVHAFWGYSFHIPNSTDTISADAGFNESGHGAYYQMIIPAPCTVDRISFWRDPGSGTPGFISFGLYDMNQSRTEFPLVARTAPFHLDTIDNGLNVRALDSRVDIAPGIYAYAYTGPCFHSIISIRNNVIPWIMVNALYNTTWNGFNSNTPPPGDGLPPFGSVITPFSTGALPDQLDSSTVDLTGAWDASSFSAVPLGYFDDSQEFG